MVGHTIAAHSDVDGIDLTLEDDETKKQGYYQHANRDGPWRR